MKKIIIGMAVAAAAITAVPASAITYTIGAPNTGLADPTFAAGSTEYTFDDGVNPFTGGGIVDSSATGLYAAPAGDTTSYLSIGPSTSEPATLAITGVNQISFYWGSIDSYNAITFDGLGVTYDGTTFDGTDVARNGREITFNLTSTEAAALTGITLGTNGTNAFEIDNLIVGNAVPEPAAYTIMSLGLGMIGAALRRRRSAAKPNGVRFA